MQKLIPILLLSISLPVHAVICKTVNQKGEVSYSDLPADECQQRVKLPEYSTYQPRVPQSIRSSTQKGESDEQPFSGYTGVKIAQPAANGTVRSNEGKVPVSVTMQPVLQPKHKVRFFLDSVLIQPDFTSQSGTLTGVERGTHSVYAVVVDESGTSLGQTAPSSFTLRQASKLFDTTIRGFQPR